MSNETKQKLSLLRKGSITSEETKKKQSLKKKGILSILPLTKI